MSDADVTSRRLDTGQQTRGYGRL